MQDKWLKILIVDDDALDRKLLRRLLGDAYELHEVDTGTRALEELTQQTFDCALVDLRLPDMDGMAILDELAAGGTRRVAVPMVMLSQHDTIPNVVGAFRSGACDFLSKATVTREALETTIRRAVQRHEQEEERERLLSEYESFAHQAAHDLKAPLRRLYSIADVLRDQLGPKLAKEDQGWLDLLRNEAESLERLTTDLLNYAIVGRDRSTFEWVDTGSLLDSVQEELGPLIVESNAAIVRADMVKVFGDRNGLWQVFTNLVVNALRYRSAEAPRLEVSCVPSEAGWHLAVRDNGIGIGKEYIEEVFRPLRRCNPNSRGTGLGLSICARVAEQHGGRIWVESTLGTGSTFHVTLTR
jgi:signal transduction histidine kinase